MKLLSRANFWFGCRKNSLKLNCRSWVDYSFLLWIQCKVWGNFNLNVHVSFFITWHPFNRLSDKYYILVFSSKTTGSIWTNFGGVGLRLSSFKVISKMEPIDVNLKSLRNSIFYKVVSDDPDHQLRDCHSRTKACVWPYGKL